MHTWAERVIALRAARRWSRAFLAGRVGVTPQTVGRWERGDSQPRQLQRAIMEILEREPR